MASRALQRCRTPCRCKPKSVTGNERTSMIPKLPIVVVGGGTAGCMVTSHLANNTSHAIVVIEPGGHSSHDDNSRFFDVLTDAPLVQQVGDVVQAKALGGGSAINGMLLTGDEPDFVRGLTRMANAGDIGIMGQFLLENGGRFSRLWWNGGRWNPGRAVRHLEEEGRISIVRDEVISLEMSHGVVVGVRTNSQMIPCAHVVLCAGALVTPKILMKSHVMPRQEIIAQNHYSISVVARLQIQSTAPFDTAVVQERDLPSGQKFLVNAYERLSAESPNEGLMTVSHMNSANGLQDHAAMEIAIEIAEELAQSLRIRDGIDHVFVDHTVRPLSHVSSTCVSVTDGNGRVQGAQGVWVADASVLPQVPTCTPAAPVTMEALRIAHMIAGELT